MVQSLVVGLYDAGRVEVFGFGKTGARRDNTPDLGEMELNQLCLDRIARFKRPKRYEFVDNLPKNNYGKVLKTELRERYKNDATS